MASRVDIYDLASRAIGAGPVDSTGGSSVVEQTLDAVFDVTLDAVLQTNRWTFCTQLISLNRLTDPPPFRYTYAFQMPADALKLWRVDPNTPYQVASDQILSDQLELDADVTLRPEIGQLPPLFVRALYFELAAAIAIPVTQNADIATAMQRQAFRLWPQARNADAQQDPPPAIVDSPFTAVRNI